MRYRQIEQTPKTFILVFETGDELARGLSDFATEQKLSAASFKAVGGFSSVRLGWFSWELEIMRIAKNGICIPAAMPAGRTRAWRRVRFVGI